MTTLHDYAALSAFIYNDKRGDLNQLDPLTGWSQILYDSNPGFTAGAYQNGNDIVIVFKGSDLPTLSASGIDDELNGDGAQLKLPNNSNRKGTELCRAAQG